MGVKRGQAFRVEGVDPANTALALRSEDGREVDWRLRQWVQVRYRCSRPSFDLTHLQAKDFDGAIHWGRDTKTFQSMLKSFVRLDLESTSSPELPEGWEPEVVILAANADHA